MDYLYTVDDNVVTDYYVDFSEMIYVEIEYWAFIQTGTVSLAAETYAWITGAISISGNEIVLDEDVDGIYLYHYIEAVKSSWIWVDVDVAVDNNVLEAIADSDGDYSAEDAIYLDSETSVWSNDYVITPVGATVDMTWSVTGNKIVGFEYGIYVEEEIDVDYGMSSIEYAMVWDISGNEMTDITDTGVDYEFDRDDGNTYGTIEMSVGVTIDNNIISLTDRDDTYYGIYLDSWANGVSSWEYWDEQYGNHTFVASVSGNTISHAEYGLYIYGTLYLDVPSDYVLTGEEVFYTYVNDITVENNLIEDCWTGMYLEDTMNVRNNVIDCGLGYDIYGIDWYEADGELVGNTITAETGIYVDYLHTLLVQGNLIQFGETGIYIYEYDEEDPYEMEPNGTIVDNTITALYNPFLPWSSYGIELYDVFNVLISGNTISGADYGVDLDYCWNVTVEGNEISDASDSGIYVYDSWLVWIESNTVTGCYNGLYIDSENEDLVVGNNTFVANSYAIYMDADITRMVLWNNVFIDNEYGVDIYSYRYLEVVWYVDAQSRSSRSDIDINAPIFILAGGSLVLEDMELDVWSDYDDGGVIVDEGGLLSMSNVYVDEIDLIDVAGTFWASLSVFDETYVYLGPTAEAEIRTSVFDESRLVVDGCAPVIADNLFDGQYNYDVIAITIVNGAAPSIVSNVIIDYDIGIYANGMDMGGIYDNLIMSNNRAGLLVESCTGTIHDNIILENEVAILLRNSDVSVENNEIGYTDLFQVMANYATLLSLISETSEPGEVTYDLWDSLDTILAYSSFDIRSLYDWVTDHTYGIWAEGSTVRTSGNTYGLLSYAVYAIDSEVHFSDDIRTTEIVIPWVVIGENYVERYNYTADVYTLNGIYAARSDVYVSDCVIEVVDDALTFEASNAWVEGATLMAGDFDYFVFGGSDVYNIATTYAKAKVMDSHSLNEGTWLTITFLDKGDAAANISVVIKNAKGEIVFNGTTDADGKVKILLTQYSYTSEGKDDGFNPYTIIADFESGEKSTKVVLDQSYQDLTIEGEEESDMGAILAVVGVLVIILLIVAAVVVMRRRK